MQIVFLVFIYHLMNADIERIVYTNEIFALLGFICILKRPSYYLGVKQNKAIFIVTA